MNAMDPVRTGFAVPAVLALLAMAVVLGLAAVAASDAERQGGHNFVSSGQAFWAAEAGLESSLDAWDQGRLDTLLTQTGDSVVGSRIDLPNDCAYRTVIHRIDGVKGRALYRVASMGESREASRTVAMLVIAPGVQAGNAITVGGRLEVSGPTTLRGGCAHLHVNGTLLKIGGHMDTEGDVSSSGTIDGENKIENPDGDPVDAAEHAPQQPIPAMLPSDYCGEADFTFAAGRITNNTTGIQKNINGSTQWGWEYSSGKYTLKSKPPIATGTLCFDNDVEIPINLGTTTAPYPLSIITTQSVSIPGHMFLVPDHPDGIGVLALGDVKLNGNVTQGTEYAQGTIYANSQCELSGSMDIAGRLICRDNPNPSGSENWASENKISGNTNITYDCPGGSEQNLATPISDRPWFQVMR